MLSTLKSEKMMASSYLHCLAWGNSGTLQARAPLVDVEAPLENPLVMVFTMPSIG